MIERLRFCHLEGILEGKPNYAKIMVDVFGFQNRKLGRKFVFRKLFSKSYSLVEELKNLEIKSLTVPDNGTIKIPNKIDNITFRAMMELNSLSNKDGSVVELMGSTVAVACYSENNDGDYDSSSEKFIKFKEKVMNSPLTEVVGIYNWIVKKLDESGSFWEKRFFEVEFQDEDYVNAGGESLKAFNVLNTIKKICKDFNLTYEEAWQLPYSITQTNALESATSNYVQRRMTELKESKMRAERKRKG
ncbi:hypothetical protein [Tenacibaculum phage Larrie]|nr:hypothetical protein [Tenacibaculum phage Larrie]